MPIQTNLALETALFHVPLPATADDVERLNACWQRHPLNRGRVVAGLGPQGLVLTIEAPVVFIAVNDDYWKELGAIIARTGEPWWDFCAVVVDCEPQLSHPHAHALSVYRVFANGRCAYLHHEDALLEEAQTACDATPDAGTPWPELEAPRPSSRLTGLEAGFSLSPCLGGSILKALHHGDTEARRKPEGVMARHAFLGVLRALRGLTGVCAWALLFAGNLSVPIRAICG